MKKDFLKKDFFKIGLIAIFNLFLMTILCFSYCSKQSNAVPLNSVLEKAKKEGVNKLSVIKKTNYDDFCVVKFKTDKGKVFKETIKESDCLKMPPKGELVLSQKANVSEGQVSWEHSSVRENLFWWWVLSKRDYDDWYYGGDYYNYRRYGKTHTSGMPSPTGKEKSTFQERFQKKSVGGESFKERFSSKFGRSRSSGFRWGGFSIGK